MNVRRLLTGKNLVITLVSVTLVLAAAGYLFFRRPPRVAMEKYVPASALVFLEIDSLTDLLDGLTNTRTWREVGPILGLSSQLKQLGSGLDVAGRTGLGPAEVVLAGRAQYAAVVTGVDASTEEGQEGVSLRLKPRFALMVETHSGAAQAERIVNDRISIVAARIFGDGMKEESKDYAEGRLKLFHAAAGDRQLVATASGSIVLIGNHESALTACLDAIARRTPTLDTDEVLRKRRGGRDEREAIFAYFTQTGIETFAQLAPTIFASRMTNDPERLDTIAGLFAHLSKQTAEGFFYSLEFAGDGVTEKYETVMRPELAAGLHESLKPAAKSSRETLQLVPADSADCTILTVESAGAMPERLLKNLSSGLDVVASLALREYVISLREEFGLAPGETLERAVGSEMAIVRLNEEDPTAMVFQVREQKALTTTLNRYLTRDGAKASSTPFQGIEIMLSSNDDGRSAAFVDNLLVLGTRQQIERMIEARAAGRSARHDAKITAALQALPLDSSVVSYDADAREAAEMMLTISRLTRVTDGSPELLEREPMQKAILQLPITVSHTQFRESGIYIETHSAVGVFKRIAGWLE